MTPYLFQCHAILNQQCNPRVEVSDIFFEDKVLLGLARNLGFVVPLYLLGFPLISKGLLRCIAALPLARSSSISKSFSFADIERYNAVEYRLD